MDVENASAVDHYSTNVQASVHKCDVCAYTFRTSCERNLHILGHFKNSSCSICQETLIQLGNIWYGPHKHSNHHESTITTIPAETNECGLGTAAFADNIEEFQLDPLSAVKSEYEIQSEIQILDCNESGATETAESISTNTQKGSIKTSGINLKSERKNEQCTRNKSSEATETKMRRQQRSTVSTQKRWKCDLCNAEFLFEANLIEHQDEHEKPGSSMKDAEQSNSSSNSDTQSDAMEKAFDASSNDSIDNEYQTSLQKSTVVDKSDCHQKLQETKITKPSELDDDLEILTYDDIKTIDEMQLDNLNCLNPNKKNARQNEMKNRLRVHEITYRCKLSKSIFPTMEEYRVHKTSVHELDTEEQKSNENTNDADAEAIEWICEYCNGEFDTELNLAKHLVKTHDAKKSDHLCNICTEKFTELEALLTHMRNHCEIAQHKCSIDGCNRGFAYKMSLAIHLNKHKSTNRSSITRKTQDNLSEIAKHYATISIETDNNDKKPMNCEICSKELASRASLLLHIQTIHIGQQIRCTNGKCSKIFRSNTGLYRHMKLCHPEDVNKCDICHKFVYSKEKFSEHQLRHNQPGSSSAGSAGSFACNICTMTFLRKFELRSHLNKHEKDISCTLCNEKFSTVKLMLAHRERHGKTPVYTCRYENCNLVFEDRREFMKHAREHPDSGRKRFLCPYCGKGISRTYIADHINTHTKSVSHQCTYCGKTFIKKCSLRRHLMIHTGEKPYACDVDGCTQKYRDSIDLKRHKFSVHKIYTKKHTCSICSKVFSERKLLRNHIIKVHDKVDHEAVLRMS